MPGPDAPLPPIDDTPPSEEHPEGPKPEDSVYMTLATTGYAPLVPVPVA